VLYCDAQLCCARIPLAKNRSITHPLFLLLPLKTFDEARWRTARRASGAATHPFCSPHVTSALRKKETVHDGFISC